MIPKKLIQKKTKKTLLKEQRINKLRKLEGKPEIKLPYDYYEWGHDLAKW